MTGKQDGEQVSRLCKKDFMRRFLHIVKRIEPASSLGSDMDEVYDMSYDDLKRHAVAYQVRYTSYCSICTLL